MISLKGKLNQIFMRKDFLSFAAKKIHPGTILKQAKMTTQAFLEIHLSPLEHSSSASVREKCIQYLQPVILTSWNVGK